MSILIIGLIVFLGVHSVAIVAPEWRAARVRGMGEGSWKGLYSVVAGVGLVLLIYGYGLARQSPVVLYTPAAGIRHLALLLMVPVFVLLAATYLPGRIKAISKHPMLVATKLWAVAHLLANGTLADVLLFGGFLAWAVADRISAKRRPARTGEAGSAAPGVRARPVNDVLAVVIGLTLYAVFVFGGHRWLFGVSPLPG